MYWQCVEQPDRHVPSNETKVPPLGSFRDFSQGHALRKRSVEKHERLEWGNNCKGERENDQKFPALSLLLHPVAGRWTRWLVMLAMVRLESKRPFWRKNVLPNEILFAAGFQ